MTTCLDSRHGLPRARGYSSRMKLISKWLLSAAALLAVAYLYSGVAIASFGAALITAFVIGLLTMLLRPPNT